MLPSGTYNEDYQHDTAIMRTRFQWLALVAFLIFLFCLPLFGWDHLIGIINLTAIALVAVLGLNILTGLCGQISLGQSAFMGVGAYVSGFLAAEVGLSFWLALPCAGIGAGLVGLLFGLPSLRVKGFYLVLATVAAQFIIVYAIQHTPALGGTAGLRLPPPQLAGIDFRLPENYYYITVGVTVLMVYFAKNLSRTRVGRAFIAIRDNDIAAEVMGINLFFYKLLAFFICSFYAGIAGALWGFYTRYIHPEHFTLVDSIWYLGMMVVGGMGSTAGAIFGTVFFKLLGELTSFLAPALGDIFPNIAEGLWVGLALMVYGLIIVLFLMFEPRGIAHRWEVFKSSYRLWPYSY